VEKERIEIIKQKILNYAREIVAKELFGDDVEDVVPSENIWNAWVIRKSGLHDFVTGGYSELWSVIKEALLSALKEVDEVIAKIEQEWEEKVKSTQ